MDNSNRMDSIHKSEQKWDLNLFLMSYVKFVHKNSKNIHKLTTGTETTVHVHL